MADQHAQDSYSHYLLENSLALDIDTSHSELATPSSTSDSSSLLFGASHAGFVPPTPNQSYPHHQHQHHHNQHTHTPQSSHIGSLELTLDPSQLNPRPSSVGPNRVLTRRQARIAQQQSAHANPSNNHMIHNQRQQPFADGFVWHSPSNELHISTTITAHQPFAGASPPHPGTPSSVSSGFSHYGFHPYPSGPRGHSRSTSSATNPRSTSPAISTASAATSISSGNRSRPPISSGSAASSIKSNPKTKKRLTNKQRKEICLYYEAHPTSRQEDIAKLWDVERSTVSKILKNKSRWIQVQDDSMADVSKSRSSKFPIIESLLSVWLRERTEGQKPVSDIEIRTRAKDIAKNLGVSEDKFKASAGWVENFKHRNNIKKGVFVGLSMPNPDTFVPEEHQTESMAAMVARQERDDLLRSVDESALRAHPSGLDMGGPQSSSSSSNATNPDATSAQGISMGQTESGQVTLFPFQMQSVSPSHGPESAISDQSGMSFQQGTRVMQPSHSEGNPFWGTLPQAHAASGMLNAQAASSVDAPSVSAHDAYLAFEQVSRFLAARPLDGLSKADNNVLTDLKHHIFAEKQRERVSAATTTATTAMANQAVDQASVGSFLGVSPALTAGAPVGAS